MSCRKELIVGWRALDSSIKLFFLWERSRSVLGLLKNNKATHKMLFPSHCLTLRSFLRQASLVDHRVLSSQRQVPPITAVDVLVFRAAQRTVAYALHPW